MPHTGDMQNCSFIGFRHVDFIPGTILRAPKSIRPILAQVKDYYEKQLQQELESSLDVPGE